MSHAADKPRPFPPGDGCDRQLRLAQMATAQHADMAGRWDAGIVSPGGLISFGLEMVNREGIWSAAIFNGVEKIAIPSVEVRGNHLELAMPHYDSTIKAAFDPERQTIGGTWKKRRGRDEWVWMKMQGTRSQEKNFDAPENFVGRWKVRFESSQDPAVGIFRADENGRQIQGTFLTTTGDYRYLFGGVRNGQLSLSCFDGAHAFLFKAKKNRDDS